MRAVLLDVNGTLTDTAPIGDVWGRPELGDRVLAHAVHTGSVAALLGGAGGVAFSEHLRAAVEVVADGAGVQPGRVDDAMAAAASLPARPGAREGLAALRAAGLTLVALTNSGAAAGEATLRANGLLACVDRVLGVDAVATFKPAPAVYAYGLAELGVEPSQVVMLATHPWDLAGAAAAGMRTAWVRHGARAWPSVFADPDHAGDTLPDVCEQIAG